MLEKEPLLKASCLQGKGLELPPGGHEAQDGPGWGWGQEMVSGSPASPALVAFPAIILQDVVSLPAG